MASDCITTIKVSFRAIFEHLFPKMKFTCVSGAVPGSDEVLAAVQTHFAVQLGFSPSDTPESAAEKIDWAAKDLAELMFTAVCHKLDPQFMVAVSPKLSQFIDECIKDKFNPYSVK